MVVVPEVVNVGGACVVDVPKPPNPPNAGMAAAAGAPQRLVLVVAMP